MKFLSQCVVIPVGSQIYGSPSVCDYIVSSKLETFNQISQMYNDLDFKLMNSPTKIETYICTFTATDKVYVRKSDIGKTVCIYYIIYSNDTSFYTLKMQNLYLMSLININNDLDENVKARLNSIIQYAKSINRYGNGYPTGMGYLWYAKNTISLNIPLEEALLYINRLHLYHSDSVGYLYIWNCNMDKFQ